MKKLGIILLFFVLTVFGLSGCGIVDYFTAQREPIVAKKLPEMVLNEPFVITTANGDYSVTINGARTTPQRDANSKSNPKAVIFLDYMYENISYEKRNNMDFFLAQGDFMVSDDAGNELETYNIKDPKRMIQETPIGGSCAASIAYALETESESLTVTFVRGKGREIAQIIIPIEE
ncbi:hypothetical protein LNN31_03800 [Acetobacterium wieringae]|uniref:DUF5067 domain-containing protein n=1 Tax=Acetobacterium wieringae TaxID=52694 RepID=A0ABY6HGA3_9FIRM|nr:hypothetical protein [Acetobacterium wieringae]MEA4804553.1 hypothetical protein [Acetobacterium wieringae]UYO63567.1 hypothetical protein LNN31_03800 [Acetobacterium wieringae]VUZ26268.1 Uncharacterised protein [Acetobacterium wieringae]